MTIDEYNNASRTQKLAVFLTVIGAESAARILAAFEDHEIEQIAMAMTKLELISDDVQQRAVEEFSQIISESVTAVSAGFDFTRGLIEQVKGRQQAERFMTRLQPARNSSEVIKEICEMDPRHIHNLIKLEQPQTMAFILSFLTPRKAADVIMLMTPDVRAEVTVRMGSIEATSSSAINTVVRRLERHLDSKSAQTLQDSGGAAHLAETLNLLDRTLSRKLLANIDERDAVLAVNVRKHMFSFEDIMRLSVADLQRILREVESATLAIALKPVGPALREKIYAAMSKRAAEGLREEIDFMAAVRLRDVEAAQETIITTIRSLEESGDITVGAEAEEYV